MCFALKKWMIHSQKEHLLVVLQISLLTPLSVWCALKCYKYLTLNASVALV